MMMITWSYIYFFSSGIITSSYCWGSPKAPFCSWGHVKKSEKLAGNFVCLFTFLLIPFPPFSLVDSLRLWAICLFQTMSILSQTLSCCFIHGRNTLLPYSSKVTACFFGKACIMAAPSKTLAWNWCGGCDKIPASSWLNKTDIFVG